MLLFLLYFYIFFILLLIVPIYKLASKFSKVLYKTQKLNKTDFLKNQDYYRDILKQYSVTELSYIDNFELNNPKDIVAILLHLENLGKISLDKKNNKIIINDKKAPLKREEEYVLNCIYEGKIDAIDIGALTIASQKSALVDKLLLKVNKSENKKSYIRKVLLFLIIIIFLLINIYIINNINNIKLVIILMSSLMVTLVVIIFLWLSYFLYDTNNINNLYKRSDLGEEINKKLEGLKLFLKDFSKLDEKEAKELIIWEDYLIYSVMFNQNKKIIDEYFKKYFKKF